MTDDKLSRLHNMILNDNLRIPNGAVELLKSELYAVLDEYLDLAKETVELSLIVEDGRYVFSLCGEAREFKKMRIPQKV